MTSNQALPRKVVRKLVPITQVTQALQDTRMMLHEADRTPVSVNRAMEVLSDSATTLGGTMCHMQGKQVPR